MKKGILVLGILIVSKFSFGEDLHGFLGFD